LLESLNDKHRRVVELVCFCGLTIPEVAALAGESTGNVQHHYYRSIERLRAKVAKARESQKSETPAPSAQSGGFIRQLRKSARALAKEVESVKAHIL